MKNKIIKDKVTDGKDVGNEVIKQDILNGECSMRMSRRTFVKVTGAAVGALALGRFGFRTAEAAQSLQVPLAGSAIPQFIDPLPTLSVAGGTMNTVLGNQLLDLTMREFDANILPTGTFAPGVKPTTKVWGYTTTPPAGPLDTYIGPVIISDRSTAINPKPPTVFKMTNALGNASTTNVLAYRYSTDQTLHWADPLGGEMNMCAHAGTIPAFGSACAQNYSGSIPAVFHLHGGEVPPMIDGGPDAWFTSDGTIHGHGYFSELGAAGNQAIYNYPNTQEASPIWFHDHTLGATRLNVYAGLAGAYVINDPAYPWYSTNLAGPIVPLVLQDRMFDTTGQLFFPGDTAGGLLWTMNPDHPYWVPEFVGDTIVVNGKVWPFFNVAPQRYRFLFLNGSNARTYELFLLNQTAGGTAGPVFWQIGTDGGYLDKPVKVDPNDPVMPMKLTLMPGERADVIIDFTGLAPGTILLMRNTGRTPYPKGKSPQGSTTGRILQFNVVATPGPYTPGTFDPTVVAATLRSGTGGQSPPIVRFVNPATGTQLVTPAKVRQLTLNEVMKMASTAIDPVTGLLTAYPGGPLEILVNNTKYDGLSSDKTTFPLGVRPDFTPKTIGGVVTYYSEVPKEGDTEMWEIINLTADAHPIHLHLVQFQLVNRQNFNTNNYNGAYAAAFPVPAAGVAAFIPAFGPPLHYTNGTTFGPAPVKLTNFLGGNPDVTPYLQGAVILPASNEAGWKDTIMALPGQVTRIMVRFAPTDMPTNTPANQLYYPFNPDGGHGYVWHCHIIDHEDNEMMRPYIVTSLATPAPVASITGPASGTLNTPVTFQANVTWAQGLTGTVAWSAQGGTPAAGTGSTFAVAFAAAGTYTITATATDSRGNTSTATTTITIV